MRLTESAIEQIFLGPNKKTPAPTPWAPGSRVALIGWQMVSVQYIRVHVCHSVASFSATVKFYWNNLR
jgi:hypothetical protein